MTSEILSSNALILLASRPETVEVALKKLRPETLGVIVSQEILEAVSIAGRIVLGGGHGQ